MRALILAFAMLFASVVEANDFCGINGRSSDVELAPDLVGSPASQRRQNEEIDLLKLERIANDRQLKELKRRKVLVPLPTSEYLRVDERLASKWRWCQLWTAQFLDNLAAKFYYHFRTPLQVNSAVRTIAYQASLTRHNGNAAPTDGDRASSHIVGSTVDIAKKFMTLDEIRWMQVSLLDLERQGLVEATEEHNQSVFHIMVFKRYEALTAQTSAP